MSDLKNQLSPLISRLQSEKRGDLSDSEAFREQLQTINEEYGALVNQISTLSPKRNLASYIHEIERLPEYNADGQWDIHVTERLLHFFDELQNKVEYNYFKGETK